MDRIGIDCENIIYQHVSELEHFDKFKLTLKVIKHWLIKDYVVNSNLHEYLKEYGELIIHIT